MCCQVVIQFSMGAGKEYNVLYKWRDVNSETLLQYLEVIEFLVIQ